MPLTHRPRMRPALASSPAAASWPSCWPALNVEVIVTIDKMAPRFGSAPAWRPECESHGGHKMVTIPPQDRYVGVGSINTRPPHYALREGLAKS